MQILTDVGPAATGQPAPSANAAAGQPNAEKPAAKQRGADNRTNKRKRQKRPAPYEMRDFLAGRW
jgi:hypothetical protein